MRRVTVFLLIMLLAGCVSTPVVRQPRVIEVDHASDEVLAASLDVLVERGFVIRLADPELGRIDAVLAARPGYEVRVETSEAGDGTRLALSGRRGRRNIEPYRFDILLVEITSRLESN